MLLVRRGLGSFSKLHGICPAGHCLKSVQIRSFFGPYFHVFSPNIGKYSPEKTPYLDTFDAVDI